jgi:anti-anti-sigma regulatory factor
MWPFFLTTVFAVLVSVISLTAAQSQQLTGADSPEFQAALSLWLDGDDEHAIITFSELAHKQHAASQVLLGLIDKTAALQGPMFVLLSREQRSALLRAKGGLSGRNWMTVAAETEEIAQNWVSLWEMSNGIDVARSFAQMQEKRAARHALLMTASRQGAGFEHALMSEHWYPAALRHLNKSRALSLEEVADLHAGHPIRKAAGLPVSDQDLRDWLQKSPLALHLRAPCKSKCPKTQANCTLALYHGIASYDALLVIGSPSTTIIAESDFAASARGQQSIARHIMVRHSARMREGMLRHIAPIDECAANWLQAEFRRYLPVPRASPMNPD